MPSRFKFMCSCKYSCLYHEYQMCLIGPALFMEAHSSALAVQTTSEAEQRNC